MKAPDDDLKPDELRDILDVLPDLVAAFDRERRLLFLNASGRSLLAWNLLEKTSLPVLGDLFTEDDAALVDEKALPVALERGSWTGNVSLQPASGEPRLVTLTVLRHPASSSKSRAFTVIGRPAFDSARDQALRLVHDLNNFIGPILGYSGLVGARLEAESGLRRFVDPIRDAAERARDVLARFSMDGPRSDYFQVVDLAELAADAVSWMRAEFPLARIDLRAIDGDTFVYGDSARLRQVVLNLCRNAAESLGDSGGTIDVSFSSAERQGIVRFTVADDGCGIDPEEFSRIFQPHHSSKRGARGLGLTLAREIVCAHGGTLSAESAPGKGARFRVELPAYRPRNPS